MTYEALEALSIDGDAVVSADATLTAGAYEFGSLTVNSNSTLTLGSNVAAIGFPGVTIMTSGDLSVATGSLISADGQGYAGDQGTRSRGHGEFGRHLLRWRRRLRGTRWKRRRRSLKGGMTYGSRYRADGCWQRRRECWWEGEGGAVRLVVDGTLLVEGGIVCRGAAGGDQAGGGAGGSILSDGEYVLGSGGRSRPTAVMRAMRRAVAVEGEGSRSTAIRIHLFSGMTSASLGVPALSLGGTGTVVSADAAQQSTLTPITSSITADGNSHQALDRAGERSFRS